jgi:hypothetical protein
MLFPVIPDIGVDTDQIVLTEKTEQQSTQALMKSDLRMFVQYLVQGNEAWGKWGKMHPEDLPKYRAWFKKAVHMQGRVIPSMAFDFHYMPYEHVKARFQMIKQVVLGLTLEVPNLSNEKV